MDFSESITQHFLLYGLAFVALGYTAIFVMILMLPKKLGSENKAQKEDVTNQALRQKEKILTESQRRVEQKIALQMEEADSEFEDRRQSLEASEEELDILAETVAQAEQRLLKQSQDHSLKQNKLQNLAKRYEQSFSTLALTRGYYDEKLKEINSDIDAQTKVKSIQTDILNKRQLSVQRSIKDFQEELNIHVNKLGSRLLDRVSSRYAPDFIWPKSSYLVELTNSKNAERLTSGQFPLIEELIELAEDVTISLTTDKEDIPLGIKLVGGYGIYKEAAKLTLDALLNKDPQEWSRLAQVFKQHREKLERQALSLGRSAVNKLQISGMRDEILQMIGALNWRTSYRQNQYLHSLEVATLAGIVATELGVDADAAKRCGLLHDIGKGIDYRIEGSHAVISGDYADRFGENRLICDTVMSHHNDLVLETPLSYVLKTADTLSGARPGARVNIEEGYQIRLSAIEQAVRAFKGIIKVAIMSGGREVHVDVAHNKVREHELQSLTEEIARKIEEDVAFPGQIKVMVTRRFEASAVA